MAERKARHWIDLSIRALAPALAAGCTVVIKMLHQAAQSSQIANEIMSSVLELPKGVVNMFIESGSDGARLLVDSRSIPVISFTGSTHTGRQIAQAAARHLKRVGLELGVRRRIWFSTTLICNPRCPSWRSLPPCLQASFV